MEFSLFQCVPIAFVLSLDTIEKSLVLSPSLLPPSDIYTHWQDPL